MKAFVPGAGLGTRLRPLTDERPKPLVPIFGKPLITFAFDHLIAHGVTALVVNTHHRPEAYDSILGASGASADYRGYPVTLRNEPLLLDTAGGIKNAGDLLNDGPFLIHNGDVLADLDLHTLIERHRAEDNIATLALRSGGGPLHIALDPSTGRVVDIRRTLNTHPAFQEYLFTGIYLLSPEALDWIEPGVPRHIVPVLLEMIRRGRRVAGVVLDEGSWSDLGDPRAYVDAHWELIEGRRLSHLKDPAWPQPVHPTAVLGPGVRLIGRNAIGAGTVIGDGACLENCILWPGAKTAPGIHLRNCIVRAFAARSANDEIL